MPSVLPTHTVSSRASAVAVGCAATGDGLGGGAAGLVGTGETTAAGAVVAGGAGVGPAGELVPRQLSSRLVANVIGIRNRFMVLSKPAIRARLRESLSQADCQWP